MYIRVYENGIVFISTKCRLQGVAAFSRLLGFETGYVHNEQISIYKVLAKNVINFIACYNDLHLHSTYTNRANIKMENECWIRVCVNLGKQ